MKLKAIRRTTMALGIVLGSWSYSWAAAPGHDLVEIEVRFVLASAEIMQRALANDGTQGGVMNREQSARVLARLKDAGAPVLGTLRAVGMNGRETEINSVRELNYPTDYDLPEGGEGKFYPALFGTLNIGCEVVATPSSGREEDIELKLSLRHTDFLGFVESVKVHPAIDEAALEKLLKSSVEEGTIWRPVILQSTVDANVSLASGQTMLLGGGIPVLSIVSSVKDRAIDVPRSGSAGEGRVFIFVTARTMARK